MADPLERLTLALANRYRLERELGQGGMATVFLAEDLRHRRKVAIKVLRPDLAATLGADRFFREIEIAAQLQHPHILPLLDSGEADGFLFYVMPYVEGESLRERIAREGELPVPDAVRLLIEVADALGHAHSRGVVHRDIKPDNILLSGRHALVADFGVAKAVSEATGRQQLTTAGVALGTPAYMAPEQAAADPHLDHRVDIYALGAVAYELLTGRPPFTGLTPQQVLAAHVTEAVDPVTRHRPGLSPALEAVVMKCLAKHAADRWQSADEMRAQLEPVLTPSGGMTPTTATAAAAVGAAPAKPKKVLGMPTWAAFVLGGLVVLGLAWALRPSPDTKSEVATSLKTLAVLPLENRGRPQESYFADGLTEEIRNQLTALRALRVVPSTSSDRFAKSDKSPQEICAALRCKYLLTGKVWWDSVPGKPARIRVTPALIEASSGTQLWSQAVERERSGVFELQSEVVRSVAGALSLALSGEEQNRLASLPTTNRQAYEYFLQAGHVVGINFDRAHIDSALTLLGKAVALDSSFADAWAWIAHVNTALVWFFSNPLAVEPARSAAERTVRLAPNRASAHLALGRFYYQGLLDFPKAEAEFERARVLEPNSTDPDYWLGVMFRRQGHLAKALPLLVRVATLDVQNPNSQYETAATYDVARVPDSSVAYYDRAIGFDARRADVYQGKVAMLFSAGDTAGAAKAVRQALLAVSPEDIITNSVTTLPDFYLEVPELARAIQAASVSTFANDTLQYLTLKLRLGMATGEESWTRPYGDSLRRLVERRLAARPSPIVREDLLPTLGLAERGLGNYDRAEEDIRESLRLAVAQGDMVDYSDYLVWLAEVLARAGKRDQALGAIEQSLTLPDGLTPAMLRLEKRWASLRGNPRFEALAHQPLEPRYDVPRELPKL